ncbi:hypothetical protein [Neisseria sicca]|uniref:hypothetical protein n=1 Tax=Neisseria sicca TaxID=490 RepID=UPI0011BD0CAB|nr:hypothetical protein [Neisseria sicca]
MPPANAAKAASAARARRKPPVHIQRSSENLQCRFSDDLLPYLYCRLKLIERAVLVTISFLKIF